MAYTKEQQDRINAAQAKVNKAQSDYTSAATRYNSWANSISCYNDTIVTIGDVVPSGFKSLNRNMCFGSSPIHIKGCSRGDKTSCENNVDTMNNDVIPSVRIADQNRTKAKADYDAVIAEVVKEAGGDPKNLADIAAAAAAAAATQKTQQVKWILFGLLVFAIVIAAIFFAKKSI